MTETSEKPKLNPYLKLALDIGPLLLFFVANSRLGIFGGTAVFMVAVVVALGISYAMTGHLRVMLVVSAIIVLIFGGLTLFLHDETFIKVKPTIIYTLFGGALLVGYFFDKPLLEIVFDSVFHITDEGWRKLTLRWAAFFFFLAVLNEVVWRTQSTDFWLSAKLFGFMPLTFIFGALQVPVIGPQVAHLAPLTTPPAPSRFPA
jgi:intracellular septation protein